MKLAQLTALRLLDDLREESRCQCWILKVFGLLASHLHECQVGK
jgi:hypothetical protein